MLVTKVFQLKYDVSVEYGSENQKILAAELNSNYTSRIIGLANKSLLAHVAEDRSRNTFELRHFCLLGLVHIYL